MINTYVVLKPVARHCDADVVRRALDQHFVGLNWECVLSECRAEHYHQRRPATAGAG